MNVNLSQKLPEQDASFPSLLDAFTRASNIEDQDEKIKKQFAALSALRQIKPQLENQEIFRKLVCQLMEKVEKDQNSPMFVALVLTAHKFFQAINPVEINYPRCSIEYNGSEYQAVQRLLESEAEDKHQELHQIIFGMESHYSHKFDLLDQFRLNVTQILKSTNHLEYHDHFVGVIKVAMAVFNSYPKVQSGSTSSSASSNNLRIPSQQTEPSVSTQDKGKDKYRSESQGSTHGVSSISTPSCTSENLPQAANLQQSERPLDDIIPGRTASTSTVDRTVGMKSKLRPEGDDMEQQPPRSTPSWTSQNIPQTSPKFDTEPSPPLSSLNNLPPKRVLASLDMNTNFEAARIVSGDRPKLDQLSFYHKCLKVCEDLYYDSLLTDPNVKKLKLDYPQGLEKFCRYSHYLKRLHRESADLKFFETKPKNPIFEYCLFLDLQKPVILQLGKNQLLDKLNADPSLKEMSDQVRHWFESRRTFN